MRKVQLEAALGIPEGNLNQFIFVILQTIAAGGSAESIALGLKVDKAEVDSLIADANLDNQLFDRALAILRVDMAGGVLDRDFGWDDLERITLEKLGRVVTKVHDADVLTRIATAANRAKRSTDAPTPGQIQSNGADTTLVLKGGNLGTIQISLSHRVARQLAGQPAIDPDSSIIEGTVVEPRGIEMLKLSEIRDIVEDIKTPVQEESAAAKADRDKVRITPEVMESLEKMLGRQ